MKTIQPFHIAIPVHNLAECRKFYEEILGCEEGRSSELWVDFNFFGHQLVIHYKPKQKEDDLHTNPVDGKNVPVPHYGVVLDLKERLVNKPRCFFLTLQVMRWNLKLLKIETNYLLNNKLVF